MLQILFAGTNEIAIPSLEALHALGYVRAVLSTPDTALGRSKSLQASPIKQTALNLGLPVLQPNTLDGQARQSVKELGIDLLVCMAYGKIFGPLFLQLFPKGGINIHPSLLPRWRGPSPIHAAILAGDKSTGISIQKLALGMDCGDILLQREFELENRQKAQELNDYCAKLSAQMIVELMNKFESASTQSWVQDESKASYCHLIKKEDGIINWLDSATIIDRMIRAFHIWPRAQTWWGSEVLYLEDSYLLSMDEEREVFTRSGFAEGSSAPGTVVAVDKRLGLLVQTGNGLLGLRRLQLQSKKSMDHLAFSNGARGFLGSVLGLASSLK